jgi:hypothetical protein
MIAEDGGGGGGGGVGGGGCKFHVVADRNNITGAMAAAVSLYSSAVFAVVLRGYYAVL